VTSTPVDQSSLAGLPGVEDVTANGTTARFRTADAGRTLAELVRFLDAGNVAISELHVQKATLEDVFLELTGTELRH
jgi:hypothetical protein